MIALFSALVLVQSSPGPAEPVRLEGRCTYPAVVVRQAEGARLVPCGEAVLTENGVAFALRGFEPSIRFVGTWDGSDLNLHHIARRGRNNVETARGWCRLDARGDTISAIVCSVVAGPRSYVVNFIVPNI